MNFTKYTILSVFAIIFLAAPMKAVYQVGDTAADFTLPDQNGSPVSLYEFKGLPVLIYFWGDC
jgi:cytochrome oxidase Cu insertion factor (SCO1/SenC/PrrC family)